MTRRFLPLSLIVASTAALTYGCAGSHFATIDTTDPEKAKKADAEADGIRYYEEAPFLLVYSDGKGGLRSELLYLPDTTRKKVIDPYAWGAENKVELTFAHGVLTTSVQAIDEAVIPKALVEAAKAAAIAAADAPTEEAPEGVVPPPALYRLWVDPKGNAELIGGYGLNPEGKARQNIHVTVSQADKETGSKPAN